MTRAQIIVLSDRINFQKYWSEQLSETEGRVVYCSFEDSTLTTNINDIVLADAGSCPENYAEFRTKNHIIMCHDFDQKKLIGLIKKFPFISEFWGINKAPYYGKKKVEQLVQKNNKFSLEEKFNYLNNQEEIHSKQIDHYNNQASFSRRLEEHANSVKKIPDFSSGISVCAWELVTNAIFDGARTIDNQFKYRHLNKRGPLDLENDEKIKMIWGNYENRYFLGVQDPFGSLDFNKLRASLIRSHDEGTNQVLSHPAGAGIGVHMVLAFSTDLEICVDPNSKTTVLLSIDLKGSPKTIEALYKSIHFRIIHK